MDKVKMAVILHGIDPNGVLRERIRQTLKEYGEACRETRARIGAMDQERAQHALEDVMAQAAEQGMKVLRGEMGT